MANGRERFDRMTNVRSRLPLKAIQPIEVPPSSVSLTFGRLIVSLLLGDYRKWETGRTEPIRHDGNYVRVQRFFAVP